MNLLSKTLATVALTGGIALLGAAPASAAHCTGTTAEDMSSPGFSYFGTDHVQETDHNGDGAGQPEGGSAHMGNPGASNCRETTGSPSDRAPGRQ